MREGLEGKGLKGVVVREGSSTACPVEEGWADGVIVAQVCGFVTFLLRVLFFY